MSSLAALSGGLWDVEPSSAEWLAFGAEEELEGTPRKQGQNLSALFIYLSGCAFSCAISLCYRFKIPFFPMDLEFF